MNDIPASPKRPIGMTILLVLSFINACLQIFSALGMYVTTPVMSQMLANGELEEYMAPFLSVMQMDGDTLDEFWTVIENRLSVNRSYYLLTALCYIGSLVGVLKMFKIKRLGFHIYSISQMLILIVGVAFIYSKQGQSPFISEFLTTVMLILLYHLFFKRIENDANTKRGQDIQSEA